MRVETRLCDFCGKPLSTKKEKDIFGNEQEVFITGKLNHIYDGINIDLSNYGWDCCKLCASKLDLNATDFKLKNLNI